MGWHQREVRAGVCPTDLTGKGKKKMARRKRPQKTQAKAGLERGQITEAGEGQMFGGRE